MGDLVLANKSDLVAVADAIRMKTGFNDGLSFPQGFIDAINSINGNTSEPEPELPVCETIMLYEDYSPNGVAFKKTVDIDFAAGDYIEAEVDISDCAASMAAVISFGTNINDWTGTANIHCNMNKSNKQSKFIFFNTSTSARFEPTLPSYVNVIKLDKHGLYLNGNLLEVSQFDNESIYNSVMDKIRNLTSITVGSQVGTLCALAKYNYIKVVRMNSSNTSGFSIIFE